MCVCVGGGGGGGALNPPMYYSHCYQQECFRLQWLIPIAVFGPWMNHLPPMWWSTFKFMFQNDSSCVSFTYWRGILFWFFFFFFAFILAFIQYTSFTYYPLFPLSNGFTPKYFSMLNTLYCHIPWTCSLLFLIQVRALMGNYLPRFYVDAITSPSPNLNAG